MIENLSMLFAFELASVRLSEPFAFSGDIDITDINPQRQSFLPSWHKPI